MAVGIRPVAGIAAPEYLLGALQCRGPGGKGRFKCGIDLGLGQKVLGQRDRPGSKRGPGTALIGGQIGMAKQGQRKAVHLVEGDTLLAFAMLLLAKPGIKTTRGRQIGHAKGDQRHALRGHAFTSVMIDCPPSSATMKLCPRAPRLSNRPGSVPVMIACAPTAQSSS